MEVPLKISNKKLISWLLVKFTFVNKREKKFPAILIVQC